MAAEGVEEVAEVVVAEVVVAEVAAEVAAEVVAEVAAVAAAEAALPLPVAGLVWSAATEDRHPHRRHKPPSQRGCREPGRGSGSS